MNARNGKIARLPRGLREQLNERLECSEESPELLDWLNALPEVKEVMAKDFAGAPISKQNLSQWRQGGFQEWLLRRNLCEQAADVADLAEEMGDPEAQSVLADDVAVVLTARLGSLITHWDGEVDEKFEAKARMLNGIGRTVVQLQRSLHHSRREGFEWAGKVEEKEKANLKERADRLTAPWYDLLKSGPMANAFGGGKIGGKIADYILAVQRGQIDAKLELPSAKEIKPAKKRAKKKSVKPKQQRRKRQQKRKATVPARVKPLPDNDINQSTATGCLPAESESVKVNQSETIGAEAQNGTEQNVHSDNENQRPAPERAPTTDVLGGEPNQC